MSKDDDLNEIGSSEDDNSPLTNFEEELLGDEDKPKKNRMLPLLTLVAIIVGVYQYWDQGYLEKGKRDYYWESAKKLLTTQYAKKYKKEAPKPVQRAVDEELDDEDEFLDEDFSDEEDSLPPKKEEVKKAVAAKPKPAPKKVKAVAASKVKKVGSHTLLVGKFAYDVSLNQRIEKLKKLGFEPVKGRGTIYSKQTRVFVGSYPFREKAMDAANNFLNRGYVAKVKIVKAGEYSVLLGTFQSQARTDALLKKLKDKGYHYRIDKSPAVSSATSLMIKGIVGDSAFEQIKAMLEKENIGYKVLK